MLPDLVSRWGRESVRGIRRENVRPALTIFSQASSTWKQILWFLTPDTVRHTEGSTEWNNDSLDDLSRVGAVGGWGKDSISWVPKTGSMEENTTLHSIKSAVKQWFLLYSSGSIPGLDKLPF